MGAATSAATEHADDIEAVTHLMAKASMGPEFEFEIAEKTHDRCVGRTTQCPWHLYSSRQSPCSTAPPIRFQSAIDRCPRGYEPSSSTIGT